MDIHEATRRYEAWLAEQTPILEDDLAAKHRKMRKDPFAFLRGTCYRWMQQWPAICDDLRSGPRVLAVGDLHVANFGTWRDREGRLIWGINDFDEACWLPVASDLVRLATSVRLTESIKPRPRDAFHAILAGYRRSLERGGGPYVLAERHQELRALALARLKEPRKYWRKLLRLDAVTEQIPPGAWSGIRRLMPAPDLEMRVIHRQAGLGSLGRERFTAIAAWRGGQIAREAKALVPSASVWASGGTAPKRRLHQAILNGAVRCPDPFVRLRGRWIVRRLAPDCSRIEFDAVPDEQDQRQLLWAMGWETANVHLGSAGARTLLRYLARLPASWLTRASKRMARVVVSDWEAFRER